MPSDPPGPKPPTPPSLQPHSRLLASNLRAVALKTQTRLTPEVKSSICKRCESLLVHGKTASVRVENMSKGGKKAWCDVLVVECGVCQTVKRYPVGQQRQRKRGGRKQKGGGDVDMVDVGDGDGTAG
jgi:ribonuclease P protein subunit RPR2